MLVNVRKTKAGYIIEKVVHDENLPEGDFLAELQPIAQPERNDVSAAETPAAKFHAILAGERRPAPVDKEDYLTYLETKYR
jgi:hypothetical protein